MTNIFLSLREFATLPKVANSWQSITKKPQKSIIWQFVIIDCHAWRSHARNDDLLEGLKTPSLAEGVWGWVSIRDKMQMMRNL